MGNSAGGGVAGKIASGQSYTITNRRVAPGGRNRGQKIFDIQTASGTVTLKNGRGGQVQTLGGTPVGRMRGGNVIGSIRR